MTLKKQPFINDNHQCVDNDFMIEMEGVTPLTNQNTVVTHNPLHSISKKKEKHSLIQHIRKPPSPLTMEGVVPIDPNDFLEFKKQGVQDGVYKKLRTGKYPIEAKFSCKGLSLEQTREDVYRKLQDSHQKGIRVVLIQHGLGLQSKPFPALKKSYINHWLKEICEVIAYYTAQPQHGGLGAVYVLLKKHPDQKQINRERQGRR